MNTTDAHQDSPGNALLALLGHHFGDGLVYLQGARDRLLLAEAQHRGLVSDEGYLTPAGYRMWREFEA